MIWDMNQYNLQYLEAQSQLLCIRILSTKDYNEGNYKIWCLQKLLLRADYLAFASSGVT